MDVKELKQWLAEQKVTLDLSGVTIKLHREPAGLRTLYDAGYFYGYYDAIVNTIKMIERRSDERDVHDPGTTGL